jgi:hypothetical protein
LVETHLKDKDLQVFEVADKNSVRYEKVGKFFLQTHSDKHTDEPSHIKLLYKEITKKLSTIYQKYKALGDNE